MADEIVDIEEMFEFAKKSGFDVQAAIAEYQKKKLWGRQFKLGDYTMVDIDNAQKYAQETLKMVSGEAYGKLQAERDAMKVDGEQAKKQAADLTDQFGKERQTYESRINQIEQERLKAKEELIKIGLLLDSAKKTIDMRKGKDKDIKANVIANLDYEDFSELIKNKAIVYKIEEEVKRQIRDKIYTEADLNNELERQRKDMKDIFAKNVRKDEILDYFKHGDWNSDPTYKQQIDGIRQHIEAEAKTRFEEEKQQALQKLRTELEKRYNDEKAELRTETETLVKTKEAELRTELEKRYNDEKAELRTGYNTEKKELLQKVTDELKEMGLKKRIFGWADNVSKFLSSQ